MNVMIDICIDILIISMSLCLSSVLLLVTYACLSSLYWSAVASLERVRDYLGQVDKG